MSFYLLRKKTGYRFRSYKGMDEPTLFLSKAADRALDTTENGSHERRRQNKRCASAGAICILAEGTIGDQRFPEQLKRKRVVPLLPKPLVILV